MNQQIKSHFKCQKCGKCCLELGSSLSLTKEEIRKWEDELVPSNFGYNWAIDFADVYSSKDGAVVAADLFFNPDTGEELFRCPFIRKIRNKQQYECLIHGAYHSIEDLKPGTCVRFPFGKEGDEEIHSWALENCPEIKRLKQLFLEEEHEHFRTFKQGCNNLESGEHG